MIKNKIWIMFLFSSFCITALAQHETKKIKPPYWRISPHLAHTFVELEGGDKHTPVASWALDIEYWWKERMGLGLHNDLEIESFVVKDDDGNLIERDFPVVVSLDFLVKPIDWLPLVFMIGPGVEFDANKNFKLLRVGLEYEHKLSGKYDFSPAVFYDSRFNSFNTWTIALGIGRRF